MQTFWTMQDRSTVAMMHRFGDGVNRHLEALICMPESR